MSDDKWKKRFERNLLDLATNLGKLEAKVDYCPDKEKETKEKLDGIGQRFQEKYEDAISIINGIKFNFRTLIATLITLGLVCLGALSTLQVQKLPKEDFVNYQRHVNNELSAIKTVAGSNHAEILLVLGDIKTDIGTTKVIIETHMENTK